MNEKTIRILSLFVPIVKELKELVDQWKYPFVIDGEKYASKFNGMKVTPHNIAIQETINWFRTEI